MKSYDRIPHLYQVHNIETEEVFECYARDNLDAICKCPGGPESDPFTGPFRTKELLTPEGYRIMRLRDIPKGSYYNVVQSGGTKPVGKITWVKGEYDRGSRKYEVYRFDDVNHTRLRSGTTQVTIDVTF